MTSSGRDDATVQPYRCWSMAMPFKKEGTPVVGTFGQTVRSVIIMEAETFRRLCAENPALASVQFEIGEFS